MAKRVAGGALPALKALTGLGQEASYLSGVTIRNLDVGSDLKGELVNIRAEDTDFGQVSFSGINLRSSQFKSCVMDEVNFSSCDLSSVDFSSSLIFEVDFSGATVEQADFRNVDMDINIKLVDPGKGERILAGHAAIGWLRYQGAITDDVDDLFVLVNSPRYPVVAKIVEKLTSNTNNQLLGLTQRGVASADPRYARAFVDRLVSLGWVSIDKNDLVTATGQGRSSLAPLVDLSKMAPEIADFLRTEK